MAGDRDEASATAAGVWLKPPQVAALLDTSVENLKHLRYIRKGPTFYKPTRTSVLYDAAEVNAYV